MQRIIQGVLIFIMSITFLHAGNRKKHVLQTDSKHIFAMAFSCNGEVLAIGDGQIVKIFNFQDRSLVHVLDNGHTSMITALGFSPDSTTIASGDMNGVIRIWNLRDNTIRFTFPQPGDVITSLSFCPMGLYLAAGTTGNKTLIWNLEDGTLLQEFLREDDVLAVKFHPEGRLLASSGADGRIMLYDTETFTLFQTLDLHKSWVRALDFSNNGFQLVSGDDKGHVISWRKTEQGNFRFGRSERAGRSWVSGISYSDNGYGYSVAYTGGIISINRSGIMKKIRTGIFIHDILLQPGNKLQMNPVIATRGRGVIIYNIR
jgi:WD40 repeat protein